MTLTPRVFFFLSSFFSLCVFGTFSGKTESAVEGLSFCVACTGVESSIALDRSNDGSEEFPMLFWSGGKSKGVAFSSSSVSVVREKSAIREPSLAWLDKLTLLVLSSDSLLSVNNAPPEDRGLIRGVTFTQGRFDSLAEPK
uniref:Secreted protein n=1 Tax=Cacopsylla melanoneura TaxID=428564 RepID=A0A8D8SMS8_9HEMI